MNRKRQKIDQQTHTHLEKYQKGKLSTTRTLAKIERKIGKNRQKQRIIDRPIDTHIQRSAQERVNLAAAYSVSHQQPARAQSSALAPPHGHPLTLRLAPLQRCRGPQEQREARRAGAATSRAVSTECASVSLPSMLRRADQPPSPPARPAPPRPAALLLSVGSSAPKCAPWYSSSQCWSICDAIGHSDGFIDDTNLIFLYQKL